MTHASLTIKALSGRLRLPSSVENSRLRPIIPMAPSSSARVTTSQPTPTSATPTSVQEDRQPARVVGMEEYGPEHAVEDQVHADYVGQRSGAVEDVALDQGKRRR
jgi:hypothetical protein